MRFALSLLLLYPWSSVRYEPKKPVPSIVIYTKSTCPYCIRAKALLSSYGFPFVEYDIGLDSQYRSIMLAKSGGRHTVPQVFINGYHVGGYDDLARFDISALMLFQEKQ